MRIGGEMVPVATAADVGRGRLPADVIARVKQTPIYDVCQTYVRPRRSKFNLISEHTLISEHPPPFCAGEDYCQSK